MGAIFGTTEQNPGGVFRENMGPKAGFYQGKPGFGCFWRWDSFAARNPKWAAKTILKNEERESGNATEYRIFWKKGSRITNSDMDKKCENLGIPGKTVAFWPVVQYNQIS